MWRGSKGRKEGEEGGRGRRRGRRRGVAPISESNAAIRDAARLLYHFPSFWRCVYLPEGVILWIHPPTPTAAPGQAARPTSPLPPPGEERHAERGSSWTPTLWLWRFHTSFIPSLRSLFVLRQSSSGSLSSGKERMGRGKKEGHGGGESLALFKMAVENESRGPAGGGRSRGETHLLGRKNKRIRLRKEHTVRFLHDSREETRVCLKRWD